MNTEQNVLQQAAERLTDTDSHWTRDSPVSELIEHILTRFHDVHREQLPTLIGLAQRVERVHATHPACPAGLWAHLQQLQQELEAHMEKEERILFPMLSRGMTALAAHPIQAMRHEHDAHARALARIDELTHGATLPDHACNTWRTLHQGLENFKADFKQHIHLENDLLFQSVAA